MAIVGSAHVVLRAITTKLTNDIKDGFNRAAPHAKSAGEKVARGFLEGFNQRTGRGIDIDHVLRGASTGGKHAGERAGFSFGSAFQRNVGRHIDRSNSLFARGGARGGGIFGNAFAGGFNRSGGRSSRIFMSIGLRIAALLPLLGALAGGLSTVVSGLFAIGSAATSAAQSLVVIPSLLGAIIQGGGVMLAAFSGLGDALGAGMEAAKGTTAQASADIAERASDAAEAVRDAAKGVADAEEAAADAVADATRAVADAKRALADAVRNAARASRDAAEAVADAEDDLADAHERVRDAQEALTEARIEAKERLIDLQFASRSGALAERRAAMELADARWELNAASMLPADNRLRMEAQLAYEEARLNLDMIRERNGDIAKEQREAKKEGINGSDEVKAAQEELVDAQDAVRDAVEAVSDAMRNQREVAADNARAIADAQRGVADAERALADARADGAEAIRDAKEALDDARRAQDDANKTLAAGSVEARKYQEELAKLPPVAQEFVKYLVSIRGEFVSLRTAAQRGLFPGLQEAIQTLVTGLFPTLERMMFRTGQAIGNAAQSIANHLTSGPFVASFRRVTDQNATSIERLGKFFGNLARALFAMLDAARPLIDRFTTWLVVWSRGLRVTTEAKNKTGELTETFNRSGRRMKVIIDILKNLWEGLRDFGEIADNSGMRLLRSFRRATKSFADFTDTRKNRKMLRQFFDDVATNFSAIASLISVVGGAFARLGAQPAIAKIAEALEPVVLNLEKLLTRLLEDSGEQIVQFLDGVIKAFSALSESGAFNVFLGIFIGFFDTLTALMNTPVIGDLLGLLLKIGAAMYAISIITSFPGIKNLVTVVGLLVRGLLSLNPIVLVIMGLVTAFILAYKHSERFRGIIQTMIGFASVLGGYFADFGGVLMSVFKMVVDGAQWLWDVLFGHSIFPDLLEGFKTVFGAISKVVKFVVKLVVAYIRLWIGFFRKVVAPVVMWLFKNVFRPAFNGIGTAVRFVWNRLIKPAFQALWAFIKKVLIPIVMFYWNRVIKPVFTWIGSKIKTTWDRYIKPAFDALWRFVKNNIIPIFSKLWKDVVKPVMGWIGDKVKAVWQDFIKPAFEGIRDFIKNNIIPAFKDFKDGVVSMWEKLKNAAKAPVRFVIDTIYNAGIRKALNYIPGVNLGEATVPFASGGVLPGYTPGRDVHKFYSPTAGMNLHLSGGEAIMRPEFTKAVGGEAGIERLNKMAMRGTMKFARGGIVWPTTFRSLSNNYAGHTGVDISIPGSSDYGKPVFAADAGRAFSLSAGSGSYGNYVKIDHLSGYSTYYGHLARPGLRGLGDIKYVKAGELIGNIGSTGNSSGPHLHFEVRPGGTYDAALAYLRGSADPTGNLSGDLLAPAKSEGKEEKDHWWDVVGNVKDAIGNISAGIKTMKDRIANNEWYRLMASAAEETAHDAIQWANDKIPDKIEIPGPNLPFPDNPIPNPFDQGGLATGTGWMPKNVQAPERVLSPRQTLAFERLVEHLEKNGTGDGRPIALNVQVPQEASARDVVDGIVYELRRLERGGRHYR